MVLLKDILGSTRNHIWLHNPLIFPCRTMSIFSDIIWHKLQRAALDGSIQRLAHASLQLSRGQQFFRQKTYSAPFQDRSHVSMKYLTRLAHITCNTDSSVKSASALQGIALPACIKSLYVDAISLHACCSHRNTIEVFETYFVDSRRREYCDVLSRQLLVLRTILPW